MTIDELGRRAAACKRWEWLPGMVLRSKTKSGMQYYGRVCYLEQDDLYCDGFDHLFGPEDLKGAWPDLEDPATLGCVLALVRQAWPEEWHQFMVPIFGGVGHWYMGCMMHGRIIMPTRVRPNGLPDTIAPKPTEAEALVAALEAAP